MSRQKARLETSAGGVVMHAGEEEPRYLLIRDSYGNSNSYGHSGFITNSDRDRNRHRDCNRQRQPHSYTYGNAYDYTRAASQSFDPHARRHGR